MLTTRGVLYDFQVLCFHHLTPHRALPNLSRSVRWSIDVRFERADNPTESGSVMGFELPKLNTGLPIVSCTEWLEQWEDIPRGSY
jgi:hypothetical protein